MNLNRPERQPLPAKRPLESYSLGDTAPDPRILLAWAGFDWCAIAAAWAVMALLDHPVVLAFGIVVVASRLHALGVILHDACHRHRRDDSRLWWLVEAVAGWPITSTTEAMRYHHLRHHAASGTAKDPYHGTVHAARPWLRWALTLRGVVLPFWWTLRAIVGPLALAIPRLRTAYGRAFLQDRSGTDLSRHAAVIACARADLGQLAAQLAVLVPAFAAGLPVVTFYLMPLMLAGVLNARRVVYEHAWLPSERHTRLQTWESTVDHDLGLLGNALFYPHNIGLHRIHHLYPMVSFVHLPRVARTVQTAG